MDYKYSKVQDLLKLIDELEDQKHIGFPKGINPEIAFDPYWDTQSSDTELLFDAAIILSLRTTKSPFYLKWLEHHGINPLLLKIEDVQNLPLTVKEDSLFFGPGIKDFEIRKPYSLMEPNIPFSRQGTTTGSSGDIKVILPNTYEDLLLEAYALARVFKRINLPHYSSFNLYNPVAIGALTQEWAVRLLDGYCLYPQTGDTLEKQIQNIINTKNTGREINMLFGPSYGAGDPTRGKGSKVEDILIGLIEKKYFQTLKTPFLCYVVGSALSDELLSTQKDISNLLIRNALGFQEGRPVATQYEHQSTVTPVMGYVTFPYRLKLMSVENGNLNLVNSFGQSGFLVLDKPFSLQSRLFNYLVGDSAEYHGRNRIGNIVRIGENISTEGCRAG